MLSLLIKTFLFQCVLTSGQDVWPKPQQMKTDKYDVYVIDPETFQFKLDSRSPANCELINQAFERYSVLTLDQSCRKWTSDMTPSNQSPCNSSQGSSCDHETPNSLKQLNHLTISYRVCETFPHESMDEAYTLMIGSRVHGDGILFADTTWGVLRGLESFSQMVYQEDNTFKVQASAIIDFPRFSYRGVMFDTSRHFIPVNIIKQNLDAMSYNKLNVFHWHVVDDQSFPFESKKFPDMNLKGAYNSKTHVYSQVDVKDIIEYARIRGIRVIPEFDTPGHTLSWGNSQKQLLTVCYDTKTNKPSGTYGPFDPTLESTYTFLQEFYKELKEVFPDAVVHLGGDEVDFDCWKSNPHITNFMKNNNIKTYEALENYYIQRLIEIVEKLDKKMIVWQEVFDNKVKLRKNNTYVHIWKGNDEWKHEMDAVTKSGKKAILSSPYYLNYITYGIDWPRFYENEPVAFNGTAEQIDLVMGGSVCMWSEYVDASGIMPRTWPRACAVAEKLWSAKDASDSIAAVPRIKKMHCIMQRRGLRVEPINGPGFCLCDHLFQ